MLSVRILWADDSTCETSNALHCASPSRHCYTEQDKCDGFDDCLTGTTSGGADEKNSTCGGSDNNKGKTTFTLVENSNTFE